MFFGLGLFFHFAEDLRYGLFFLSDPPLRITSGKHDRILFRCFLPPVCGFPPLGRIPATVSLLRECSSLFDCWTVT